MLHLIRFFSGDGKPTILFRQFQEAASLVLQRGAKEDIIFLERKSCIGFRSPQGYFPCPNNAQNVRQCPTCAFMDVSKAYTVGDFSGYPELYEHAKEEDYCLYLAGFGEDIVKCGVTRAERFEERMREQGADFGCILAVQKGPDGIYAAEAELQARFGFANSVRMEQKMRRLVFDMQSGRENFKAAVEMVRSSGAIPDFTPQIREFSEFYPRVLSPQRTHSILGEILGAKGEILLFKSISGRHFAINMRPMCGIYFQRKDYL